MKCTYLVYDLSYFHLNCPMVQDIVGIDLSRQTNASIPRQINFVGKLEEDVGATMFFFAKGSKKLFSTFL